MKTQHPTNLNSLFGQLQATVGLTIKLRTQVNPVMNLKWFQQLSINSLLGSVGWSRHQKGVLL